YLSERQPMHTRCDFGAGREATSRREAVSTVAEPIAPGRVAELIAKEEDHFRSKRQRSDQLWKQAKQYIPRRVASSFQDAARHPVLLAPGVTGRDRLIKVEASYHGHHDALLVSVEPSPDLMRPADQPLSVPYSGGTPQAVVDLVTVVPFNDLQILERTLDRHRGKVAAIIVEPVMMNIGIVLPDDGYLAGVLDLAHRHGALLIFDEVKTGVTIAAGGATERFGVTPDLVALAKGLGGGLT